MPVLLIFTNDIKLKFRHKTERFLIFFQILQFKSLFNFGLLQGTLFSLF